MSHKSDLSISKDNLEMADKRENCMFRESEREKESNGIELDSNPYERGEVVIKIACINYWDGHHGVTPPGHFPYHQINYMIRV